MIGESVTKSGEAVNARLAHLAISSAYPWYVFSNMFFKYNKVTLVKKI